MIWIIIIEKHILEFHVSTKFILIMHDASKLFAYITYNYSGINNEIWIYN